jgi:hypothetical protein
MLIWPYPRSSSLVRLGSLMRPGGRRPKGGQPVAEHAGYIGQTAGFMAHIGPNCRFQF